MYTKKKKTPTLFSYLRKEKYVSNIINNIMCEKKKMRSVDRLTIYNYIRKMLHVSKKHTILYTVLNSSKKLQYCGGGIPLKGRSAIKALKKIKD